MASAPKIGTAPGSSEDIGDHDHFLLDGVSWETYERLLGDQERSGGHVRLTYDEGRLELMSPGQGHEYSKSLLGRLVETMTLGLGIPIRSGGSTTFRKKLLKKGLEPDECYWVRREPLVRGRRTLDLERDPAPDLVIEVEYSRSILNRLGIYAALGFEEVWRYDGQRLRVVGLNPDGSHVERDRSEVFPFVAIAEIERILSTASEHDETTWAQSILDWASHELAPRLAR